MRSFPTKNPNTHLHGKVTREIIPVDNAAPRGGDIYMAITKKAETAREHKAAIEESYRKMQRWYRLQQFARDVHRVLTTDDQIDAFIRDGRHELAARIQINGDIV